MIYSGGRVNILEEVRSGILTTDAKLHRALLL